MSPEQDPPEEAGFDPHVEDYDDQLMRGLRASGESKEFFARGRVEHLRAWWRAAGRAEPRRVLDFGCGLGEGAALLAEAFPGADVFGVDTSRKCVERAAERQAGSRARFRPLGEFEAEGGPGVDVVHVNGVLHHVVPEERPALYRRLAAMLAPRGVVAVFENNPFNPGTRWVMSRIPFDRDAVLLSPGELRRGLAGAGLVPRDTSSLFWFPRALAFLRPLERLLAPLPLGAQYGVIAERPAAGA